MRKWTWLVLVTSGALAWACGGDDDGGTSGSDTSSTGGSGGTGGGDGGNGGSDATTTSGGGNGGSGGNTSTTGSTTSTTGSGGTSTTGSGGSAGGGAGDAGAAGMAGGGGDDGTTGGEDPPTLAEACATFCEVQESSECPDPTCSAYCPLMAGYVECEDEYAAQQICWSESELVCDDYGFPVAPEGACTDEEAAFQTCLAGAS